MNRIVSRNRFRIALSIALWLLISACHRADEDDAHRPSTPPAKDAPLVLHADEQQRLGIAVVTLEPYSWSQPVHGYAVVLSHDAIAQSIADVEVARATARQSQAALERAKGLANTPGAFSADALETAQRQSAVDAAALTLARRKLSATWGAQSPWREDESDTRLRDVASGKVKLVRVTFPLGALPGAQPPQLQLSALGQPSGTTSWRLSSVWDAPADATLPGRSFFGLLTEGNAAEGERLDGAASAGEPLQGVLMPQSAVLIRDGQYWCYVARPNGLFERRAIDAARPANGGYFVQQNVRAGDAVVTHGAGLLLAREINPSTDAGADADAD